VWYSPELCDAVSDKKDESRGGERKEVRAEAGTEEK
jgi:hypothetical protein